MRNKFKKICFLIVIAIISVIAVLLSGCDVSDYEKSDYFTVMLRNGGAGYSLNDDSIKKVAPGSAVEFDITIYDGYEFVNSNIGSYSDGKFTIDKVEYSVTVDFIVRLSSDIASVENGTITVNSVDGGVAKYGQLVDFCITPRKNFVVEEVYVNGDKRGFSREANGNVIITESFDEYVSVKAVCLGKECNVSVEYGDFGTVSVLSENEVIRYGDTVRIEAVPDEECRVAYLAVNDSVFYEEDSYNFVITGNTHAEARFVGKDAHIIKYDYTFGKTDSDKNVDVYNAGDFFCLQNGIGNWEYEGYTLESWNTLEDGTGERHALGAMIAMPSEDVVVYAQYKKQTPAEYFEFSECTNHLGEEGYAISSFTDDSQSITEVVLPDSYKGKKVFSVADEAFRGVDSVYSIVTNTNIEKIGDYAFADMENLTELCLYDGLRELSENALSETDLRHLHMNSATKRIYDKILETNIVDKQMLVKTSTNKKIVTLSGCSLAKGMKSEMIYENEYLKDYDIINMGVHARYGLGFLMDMVDNYLNPGDIVVISLEFYEHLWFTENGMRLVNAEGYARLKHLESNYDIYEEFDLVESRGRNEILPVLSQYFATRAKDMDSGVTFTSTPGRDMMNEHGDYTYFRPNALAESYLGNDPSVKYPRMGYLEGVSVINEWAQKHIDRGVKFCFIYPPTLIYETYFYHEIHVRDRNNFNAGLNERLIFPVLGTIDDVAMTYECFYNHIYHPSTYGAEVYTGNFIRLLSDAIAKGVI